MTTNDVAKLLKLNKDMYQHSDRPFTDDTLAVWLTVWTAALKDVPTEAGLMALHRAFTVCRFPVTLADLCAQLRSMQAANCTPVGTMWERILKAAHEAKENMSRYPRRNQRHSRPDGTRSSAAAVYGWGLLPPFAMERSCSEFVRRVCAASC